MAIIPFFDAEIGRVISISSSELVSGAVLAKVEGVPGEVWIHPAVTDQVTSKHPPFNESVCIYIERIRDSFAEHYPRSFEEWEADFQSDDHPAQQIAAWLYSGDVYRFFADNEPCGQRRMEIYKCVMVCMNSNAESVWDIYEPQEISPHDAQRIVNEFFMISRIKEL